MEWVNKLTVGPKRTECGLTCVQVRYPDLGWTEIYRVIQQKPDAENFNSKETSKTGLKLIIYFKTFKFFKLWFGQETAVAEVWLKMTTFQMLSLFVEHFYIASGFW